MQKTLINLTKAFIGESQARNRYDFYAKIARKEGYEKIGNIFALTAEQEKEHAKRLFEHIQELKEKLNETSNEITTEGLSPNTYGTTAENLKAAMAGENFEYTQLYPEFAKVAKEEGLDKIADRLLAIAKAEEHHEERYKKLLAHVEAGTMFERDQEVWWVCMECGYVHFGTQAPEKCPSCDHAQAFYEFKSEDY